MKVKCIYMNKLTFLLVICSLNVIIADLEYFKESYFIITFTDFNQVPTQCKSKFFLPQF